MYQPIKISIDPRKCNKKKTKTDENAYQTPIDQSKSIDINTSLSPISNTTYYFEPETMGNDDSNGFNNTPRTNDETILNKKLVSECSKEGITPKSLFHSSMSKPELTSIESKMILKEYSLSKRYKEDIDAYNEHKTDINQPGELKSEYEKLVDYQLAHLPIPIDKADDDKYKLIAMQKMKRVSLPVYKSAKMDDELKPSYQKHFNSSMEYSIMKRKKRVNSTKKDYTMVLPLYLKHKAIEFPLFNDKQIGIYEYWQEHMIKSVSITILLYYRMKMKIIQLITSS